MKKIAIISLAIISSFSYGLLVGKYELFPYKQLQYIKNGIDVSPKAFIDPINDTSLPNILIIGDSISIEYTYDVRRILDGVANTYRIPENGRDTHYGKRMINKWVSERKYSVIHFNWGLWDMNYRSPNNILNGKVTATPEEYRDNLEALIPILKKTGAKLIWCNTTPVPIGTFKRKHGDALIYNSIALEIMNKNNIQINDLYRHTLNSTKDIQIAKDVHFTSSGSEYLASKVAKTIRKTLLLAPASIN